jgi:hypothetical protein
MIVIFLAMLMVGMGVIAMMSRLPAVRLDATVREISALMRQARTLARIHTAKQTLVVDLDARRYGIEGMPLRKFPDEVGVKIEDFLTGDADNGSHRLVFSPSGGIEGGALSLTAGKRSISIKPDPVMGFLISREKRN